MDDEETSRASRPSRPRRRWVARALAIIVFAALMFPGLAPATIQEQRARLPPPAECDDSPVTGRWKSHQYDPRYGDWTIFILDIRYAEGSESQLVGTITNHSWEGGPSQEEPGPCSPGRGEWIVSMDGQGRVDPDGRILFGGVGAWRLDRVICSWGPGGYNLDNFSGVIEPDLNEFQSVNNDGGRAVNDPTVFRRIACAPPPPGPQNPNVVTSPPDFYPSRGRGGCGF